MSRSHPFVLSAFAALALIVGGCSSSSSAPDPATEGLLPMRNDLIDGKAQIQKTTAAARDLVDQPRQNLSAQMNLFTTELDKLEQHAARTRSAAAAAEASASNYFTKWDADIKSLSGTLAERAEARREKSMASYGELQNRIALLRQDFKPFMEELQQSGKYLKTDTTAEGVKVATPSIRNSLRQEQGVLRRIDAVVEQIDAVRGGK